MMLGAAAFFLYAWSVSWVLRRYKVSALSASLLYSPLWFVVSFCLWHFMGLPDGRIQAVQTSRKQNPLNSECGFCLGDLYCGRRADRETIRSRHRWTLPGFSCNLPRECHPHPSSRKGKESADRLGWHPPWPDVCKHRRCRGRSRLLRAFRICLDLLEGVDELQSRRGDRCGYCRLAGCFHGVLGDPKAPDFRPLGRPVITRSRKPDRISPIWSSPLSISYSRLVSAGASRRFLLAGVSASSTTWEESSRTTVLHWLASSVTPSAIVTESWIGHRASSQFLRIDPTITAAMEAANMVTIRARRFQLKSCRNARGVNAHSAHLATCPALP